MSSVLPFFALNSRRYFGTLLVNNSSYLHNNTYSDGILVVTARQFSYNSDNNVPNPKSPWTPYHHQTNMYRYLIYYQLHIFEMLKILTPPPY